MQRARWIRDGREGSESIDEPHNAVAHMRDIKIQQQTEPESTKLEISEQLSAIHDCVPDILLDHLCVLCVSIASFALPNLHLLFAASCFATSAGRWGHQPSGAGGILTRRCT